MTRLISTPAAMENFGQQLAQVCSSPGLIHLIGDLGTGKTTLVRGFLRALGHCGMVKSPTYTLVEPYHLPQYLIYHFDFYRLVEPEELEYLGLRDYLEEDAICLIEWPERGKWLTPPADIVIQLFHQGEERLLEIQAPSQRGKNFIQNL